MPVAGFSSLPPILHIQKTKSQGKENSHLCQNSSNDKRCIPLTLGDYQPDNSKWPFNQKNGPCTRQRIMSFARKFSE